MALRSHGPDRVDESLGVVDVMGQPVPDDGLYQNEADQERGERAGDISSHGTTLRSLRETPRAATALG